MSATAKVVRRLVESAAPSIIIGVVSDQALDVARPIADMTERQPSVVWLVGRCAA